MAVNEELLAFAADLANELECHEGRERARSKKDKARFTNAVYCLLHKAMHSLASPHCPAIELSLRRGHYSSNYRYRSLPTAYRPLCAAYRAMCDTGLLKEARKGWFDAGSVTGQRTAFLVSKKLQKQLQNAQLHKLRLPPIETETIILKDIVDGIGTRTNYTDTPSTFRMRNDLERINRCIARHWIDLLVTDDWFLNLAKRGVGENNLDLSKTRLERIFARGSFELGGRFYGGWWQHVPKALRPFITIDGKQTVEYDYSQLNPHIAYQYAGEDLGDEDAYSRIAGEEHRDVAKVAFNAMLNAGSPLSRKPAGLDLKDRPFKWAELRSKVLKAHEPIRDLFFQGIGLRFQYLDSQIAEKVMLSFVREDAPCLPIHDSFIMHYAYGAGLGELEDEMRRAFHSVIGSEIKVKGELVTSVEFGTSGFAGMTVVDHLAVLKGPPEYRGWWERNS